MSFWTTSDGNAIEATEGGFEADGGNVVPIPDGSYVLALIMRAAWAKDQNYNRYIEIEWGVDQPIEYGGRRIWQKLWVDDADPKAKTPEKAAKKRDGARKMLVNIDALCGGKLAKSGKAPDDDALALALQGKPLIIKTLVWEMTDSTGKSMSGNWVSGVYPREKGVHVDPDAPKPAPRAAAKPAVIDDEIPF